MIKRYSWYFIPFKKGSYFHRLCLNLLIENIHVKREYLTKFLGVFIDRNLSQKQHIDIVSTKMVQYAQENPLLNDMKVLNGFKLNIFIILCFMYKCKQNLNSSVFHNIFTRRTKTNYALLQNENSIQEPLCRTNFIQYCISYRGPNLWNKIAITKKNFQ